MKAIIFDLDDTLYNEKYFVYGGMKEVAVYLEKKYQVSKNILFEEMVDILKEEGRGKIFNKVCEKYRFNEDIASLVEIYRRATPKLKLYEDAYNFLKRNKGKYNLGLITDGLYYVQWNKIKLLDIEKYFDAIIVTDDYGKEFWKPSKGSYIKMSEMLGVSFDQMVYIGDNPNKDFYAAKQLGILTIRIIREEGDHMKTVIEKDYEADYRVERIDEIDNLLRHI